MVEFELRRVAGGWDQATYGPPDQVDYVVRHRGESLAAYGSVHTFLKLYDVARLEEPDHPRFLGFDVRETPGGDAVAVDFHGLTVRTTYPELRAALGDFLGAVFDELDERTPPGERREHLEAIANSGEVLVDLPSLYDRLGGHGDEEGEREG